MGLPFGIAIVTLRLRHPINNTGPRGGRLPPSMLMPLSLALDLGTTSIAAIAVDPDGHVVSSVQRANTATLPDLPSGHAEQDPQRIRDIIVDVLSELARDLPGTPAGLGVTGQMHGVLLTDPNRHPLTGLITWQEPSSSCFSTMSSDWYPGCSMSSSRLRATSMLVTMGLDQDAVCD